MDQRSTSPETRFDGQVAIITGAGRGLGRAYALELARRGAAVVVNDVSDLAEAVASEIRKTGGRAVASRDSAATREGGAKIVAGALDSFGTIDVVINNAGFARNARFPDMAIDDFDAVIDVHLRGAFFVSQPAWRVMETKGYGRILMTSSASGTFGRPAGAAYCSAKSAVVGFTKALAHDAGNTGIRVNCLLPIAATEFVIDNPLPPDDMEALRRALGGVEGRREPERVTSLAVYLCSRACQANGQVYSSVLGRYAHGFFAVTGGWVSPGVDIATVDDIASHIVEIESRQVIEAPSSVFDEMAIAASAVRASRMKDD